MSVSASRDITGAVFGKLKALYPDVSMKDGWICQCECGNMISVDSAYLRKGRKNSCGCERVYKPWRERVKNS